MGVAGILGQLLGGVLISADIAGSGWRTIFLIKVPVGIVALALVARFVPESRGGRERLDLVGTELATLALVAVVLPLVEGQQHGWPAWTWVSFAVAPVLFVAFGWHQARRRRAGRAPLVDLGLFRFAAFARGLLIATLFGMVPAAFFFVLALYLQDGRGFSPVFSGVVFVAVGVGYFAALLGAERIAARLGRQVLAAGAVAVALGCLLLGAVAGGSSAVTLVPGLALVGLGIGLVLVPLAATVLADVGPTHAGAASGVLSTVQQVGAALGVAIIGAVYFATAPSGVEHAFVVCVRLLAGLTLATAVAVQTLPRRICRES